MWNREALGRMADEMKTSSVMGWAQTSQVGAYFSTKHGAHAAADIDAG